MLVLPSLCIFCLRPFPILFLCYIISILFAYVLFTYALFVLCLLSFFFVLYFYNIDDSWAAKKSAIKKGRCSPPPQQTRVMRNQKRSQSRVAQCRDTLLREVRSRCAAPCAVLSLAYMNMEGKESIILLNIMFFVLSFINKILIMALLFYRETKVAPIIYETKLFSIKKLLYVACWLF